MEGTTMDTADKMAVVAFGAITAAALIIAYRAYTMPSQEDLIVKYFEEAGVTPPVSNNGTIPTSEDEPMPKPPSPPITPGEATQN